MVEDEERRNASLEGLFGTQKGDITEIDICGNTGGQTYNYKSFVLLKVSIFSILPN